MSFSVFLEKVNRLIRQYVVSGANFTMTFLLLAIQSSVCVLAVWSVKRMGVITCELSSHPSTRTLSQRALTYVVRDFDKADAKAWWPVSALLVAVIYTGSKSLVRYPSSDTCLRC